VFGLNCAKCQAVLRKGALYCSQCGKKAPVPGGEVKKPAVYLLVFAGAFFGAMTGVFLLPAMPFSMAVLAAGACVFTVFFGLALFFAKRGQALLTVLCMGGVLLGFFMIMWGIFAIEVVEV
jgi:hypothetical protein